MRIEQPLHPRGVALGTSGLQGLAGLQGQLRVKVVESLFEPPDVRRQRLSVDRNGARSWAGALAPSSDAAVTKAKRIEGFDIDMSRLAWEGRCGSRTRIGLRGSGDPGRVCPGERRS
jgi:hypothetical protein